MLTTISWSNYIIAVGTLLFFWYLFLGFRFYSFEIKEVLHGRRKILFPFLGNKKIDDSLFTDGKNETSLSNLSESFSESFATFDEVKELSARIIEAAAESTDRNLSQQEFKNYLKLILDEYPYVKISSLRGTINELVVSESQKNIHWFLISKDIDDLWEETI